MTYRSNNERYLTTFVVFSLGCLLFTLVSQAVAAQELALLHCWGGHRAPMVEEMIDLFEKEHPGVTVSIQLTNCGNALMEAFLTSYAGGVAPDVVMISAANIPAIADSGALISLTPWLDREGITEDTWFPAEIESGRWKGDIYGLPIRTGGDSNSLMFYNIDVLDNAGLASVPQTWLELNEMSKRLVRYDGDTTIARAAFTPHGGDMPSPAWLVAGGASLYSDDGKEVLFGKPEGIAVGEFLYDHFNRFYVGGLRALDAAVGSSQNRRLNAFITGKLAFNFEGSWNFSFIKDQAPELRYGVALRPTKELGGTPGIHANTYHYAVPTGAKSPELSWDLVECLTLKKETAGSFMLLQERASPVIKFSRNPAYWRINPYWNVVIEALTRAARMPLYPFSNEVAVLFGNALRSSMRGDEAPDAALTEAARQAQAIVDAYWSAD